MRESILIKAKFHLTIVSTEEAEAYFGYYYVKDRELVMQSTRD